MSCQGCKGEAKPCQNRKAKETREGLFRHLDAVISLSLEKIKARGNSDRAKLSYGRLLCTAISCYGDLLKDAELESIEARLERLEGVKS